MNIQDKSKEELINELKRLQQAYDTIKDSAESVIHEHKLTEEKLHDSEETYKTLFNSINDALFISESTNDGKISKFIKVNNVACERLGYTEQELLTMRSFEINSEEARLTLPNKMEGILEKKKAIIETEHVTKDGRIIPVEISTNVTQVNGKTIFHSIARDISHRKLIEQELLKAKEKAEEIQINAEAIIENTTDSIWSINLNLELTYINQVFRNDFFVTFGILLNIGDVIIDKLPEPIRLVWMQYYERAFNNEAFKFDNKFEFDSVTRYLQVSVNPIVLKGKVIGISFFGTEITKRILGEIELVRAKEQAEESDRLKSAFLANMSHEIRTPMNGILGFAELLKESELSGEDQQKYIGIIQKSGNRMLNIINDIVDISKIEAGLMKLDLKESNINDQLEYVYTFFKPDVEAKGMNLYYKNSLPAKEAIIQTDREKLYAVLTNLVNNAIKYTNNGSIEFGYEKKGDCLEFYVKDTGIGIPKDRQEAIFERFIQAEIEDKKAKQGAGLGLSISKAYIEMLGGKIWVESEVGKGTIFYFNLPYMIEPETNNIVEKVVLTDDKFYRIKNLKILIAEDDEVSKMLIDLTVRMFSKEILIVRTGVEAIESCRNNPDIDLILMDIRMPEMDGNEATRQIRQFNKDVIIIAQTAYGLFGDREKAIEAGCNDYITKPINKDELLALIQKYWS